MWGNRLGWGISAGIVMCALFVVYAVEMSQRVSAPTEWVQTISALRTPGDVTMVLPDMSDGKDAGEFYRRAIQDYEAHESVYAALQEAPGKTFDLAAANRLAGVMALLDATHCKSMTLFADHPDDVVRYNEKPRLAALEAVAKLTTKVALFTGLKDKQAANKYYEAIFSLGLKLYQERVIFDEMFNGLGLMGEAVDGMASVADKMNDATRVAALKQFNEARKEYAEKTILPIWNVLSSITDEKIALHGGDMFELAKDSPERVWQVQAVLNLGRMKFNAGRRGDQEGAKRELRRLARDAKDPAVKQAAIIANEMTMTEYRTLK